MSITNPETTEEPVKKEPEGDKVLEVAQKLANGDITLDSLDGEVQKEFHERFIVKGEEIPEVEAKPEETKVESKAEGNVEPIANEPVENQEFLKERKVMLDKLNTLNQKVQNKEKRLADLETLNVEVPKARGKDEEIFSESNMERIERNQKTIMQNQKTVLDAEKKTLEETIQTTKQAQAWSEIDMFQTENSSLKTDKPISVLNAQYDKFITSVGGLENVDKFLSNKEFRTQKEAEGLSFPMTDGEFKKFNTVVSAYRYKSDKGYPTMRSAFTDYQVENGIVLDPVKQAATEAAQKTAAKIAEATEGATILTPDVGETSNSIDGMTKEYMQNWMLLHPTPSTPEEIKMQKTIHAQIFSRPG